MEKIIQLLIQGFGDHLLVVSKYINAPSKNHAWEVLILNANLDIREECAMSAIAIQLMEKYMEKLEFLRAKYVLISEFKYYKPSLL